MPFLMHASWMEFGAGNACLSVKGSVIETRWLEVGYYSVLCLSVGEEANRVLGTGHSIADGRHPLVFWDATVVTNGQGCVWSLLMLPLACL